MAERCFGGAARLQLLNELFLELRSVAVSIVILTRNSEHTVKKALAAVGLVVCQVIGDEMFDMDVLKSTSIFQGVPHRITFCSITVSLHYCVTASASLSHCLTASPFRCMIILLQRCITA